MRKKIEDDLSWTHYNNLLQIIVQRVECSVSSTDWEASLRSWCFLVPGGPVWCVSFFCFGGEVPSIPTYMFRDFDLFPLWFLGVRPIYPSQNFCMLRMLDSKFNFLANCRTPYLFLGGRVFFLSHGSHLPFGGRFLWRRTQRGTSGSGQRSLERGLNGAMKMTRNTLL